MLRSVIYFILFFSYSFLHAEVPILMVHSYHETYPWSTKQDQGFRSVLDAQNNFYPSYSSEYIDSKRRGFDKKYEEELVHYLNEKYKGYTPKLIYVTDDDALNFMLHNKEKLFPSSPVVFSGVNDISKKSIISDKKYAGVFEKKDILSNIELIKTLFPQEKEIVFLGDNSSTVKFMYDELNNHQLKTSGINIDTISGKNYESTLNELKAYKGKVIILSTVGGFKTKEGHLIPLDKALTDIVNMKDFIVIILEDTYLKHGTIGGFMNSGFTQGQEAAKIALKILQNQESEFPKSIDSPNSFIFDLKALKDHKITLPEEISKKSKFINAPLSIFRKYEQVFINSLYGLIIIIILGSLFFARYMYRSRKIILQREDSLEKMTQSLQKAQSIAHLGHWDWDIQNNTLWWSDEIYRIFGFEPQAFEATYDAFLEHVHPDDKNKVQEAVSESLQNHTEYQIIHRILKNDNTQRYVREEGILKVDKNGQAMNMTGIVHDITEEYEKEKALLLQSEIFNAVQDSIFVHDLDGHFIYLNENAWKSRGYSEAEMMKMTVKELDAPEYRNDPKRVEKAVEKIKEDGHIIFEVEHLCKNGDRLPVEVYAKILKLHDKTYVLSSVRDITNQKKAHIAIEASEKKYKDLIENAMVGIYRTDLSGKIQYVNPALVKMLHYDSVDEVIGENALKIYNSPQDRENFLKALHEKGHINNYELEVHDKHNVSFPVMLSATLDDGVLSGMMMDMSEVKKSYVEIEKLSKVVEQIDDSVMITDKKGVITYVNQAFCNHTGYSREGALGKTARILKSNHYDSTFYNYLWNTILRGEVFNETMINRKKNGDLFYEKKTITPLKDEHDNIIAFVSSGKDVTLETMMHKEIEHIASTDKLTGIYNRHKFEELFMLETQRSERFSNPLSLIMIDIDHFKLVNDKHGHDVGDNILKHLAKVVKENIRNLDVFARWGGEEFLVLAPNTDLDEARILAEKLRLAIETSDFPTVKNITISAGISILEENDSFDTLFKRADQALYNAKNNGRNQVSYITAKDLNNTENS